MRLQGRVAIVTGASSGIGRGIALLFADEGARVVVADLQEEPRRGKYHEQETVTPTAAEIERHGGQALFQQTDVAEEAAVRSMIDRTVERYGGLDILVNNAGIHIAGTSQDLSVGDWDRIVGINLRALFLSTKSAIPHLIRSRHGRILNIASVHAFAGGAGPAYAPAKAAVVNLTRDTALEVARHGVTVNAICPGYIETAIQDYLTEEMIAECRRRTPLPRLGRPRDVAAAALFFASDDAEWITGTALLVDGGWRAAV
jgi:NAD(P)-dependent dehydrogenase (short-subunit alcohol dehydrogenase family)